MLALVKKDVIRTYNSMYYRDLQLDEKYLTERLNSIYDEWKQEQPNLDTFLEKNCAQLGLPLFQVKSIFAQIYHLLKVQEDCSNQSNVNVKLEDLCFTFLV